MESDDRKEIFFNMKRILIAGDCDEKTVKIQRSYLDAVRRAGAVGTTAYAENKPDAEALAEAFDALLLPGGGDLPSTHFGQMPHVSCSYDNPARDLSDRLLFDAFLALGKRVLGICRGCQVGNVFLGGTLFQHLPDAFNPVLWHSGNITGRHSAAVAPNSILASLLRAGEIKVNSSHHQAIDMPGEGVEVTVIAPDGVIEAVEGENVLLVQWHPERMGDEMLPIFQWVIGER